MWRLKCWRRSGCEQKHVLRVSLIMFAFLCSETDKSQCRRQRGKSQQEGGRAKRGGEEGGGRVMLRFITVSRPSAVLHAGMERIGRRRRRREFPLTKPNSFISNPPLLSPPPPPFLREAFYSCLSREKSCFWKTLLTEVVISDYDTVTLSYQKYMK